MEYAEALEHLYGLGPELPGRSPTGGAAERPLRRFDLEQMRTLCARLGDPQGRIPAVLIAGTNGKGSTAATLAAILTAAGYRTGLYTSPHLIRVNERMQISAAAELQGEESAGARGDGALGEISDDDFARLYTVVDAACEELTANGTLPQNPSFFERLTAMAFLWFVEQDADVMVLEVGLGGRLDATNVVEPMLAVITDISLDHQEYLGNTIAAIATEKCGILRRHGTLVTLPQHPEANSAIGEVATALEVRAINAAAYLPPAERNRTDANDAHGAGDAGSWRNQYRIRVEDACEDSWIEVDSPLAGSHQQRNIALAIAAAVAIRNSDCINQSGLCAGSCYKITNAAIEKGIRTAVWPGRLERLPPNVLLDVAHNPAGAWTLRAFLSGLPAEMPRTLLFSCLRDKSLREMSRVLFPLFDSSGTDLARRKDHLILTQIANPRAAALEMLTMAAAELEVPFLGSLDVREALTLAESVTPANGMIVATGSVYLVGEVRRLLLDGRT